MKMSPRRFLQAAALLIACGLVYAGGRFLPFGLTDAERYFDPAADRKLQEDEIGQLTEVLNGYRTLSASGDLFEGWNRERRLFWKYTIAFSSYGIPSAMRFAPEQRPQLEHLLSMMIQKMKSRLVWGDFTEMGFGEDPISFQNIMYKGHLNLMYGLYQLTTGDLRYAREYTWLTNQIADEMRLHHGGVYEGTTCEPDHWFVECNAIGMLSLHIYDQLFGTTYRENEIAWTLDFIEKRMIDPETGLFYRQYHPSHDVVDTRLLGYNNAWIITFLRPIVPEWSERLYPIWKEVFVTEFGPYATVDGEKGGTSDPVAHVFGMWVAKEMGDVELYRKLRNTTDKLGRLTKDPATGGMTYQSEDGILINGVVLATKLHGGWDAVLDHDWGHPLPVAVPDVSDMQWNDLLPAEVYDLDPERPLPEPVEGRDCPNCLWGDPARMNGGDAAARRAPTSPSS
ncbi:MAG: hypothetical protein JRH01_00050 [Deltaproteobacteria bacterium]|nr:hypothetical protein [Deltaproteobacteria bacterium]